MLPPFEAEGEPFGAPLPPESPRDEQDLERVLAERFGIEAFRPWQREAVQAVLRPGGRVLVIAPTGGGKSLCYQLPAVVLPGTALVLSPLISLMEDQVRSLEARGIPATFVASSLPPGESGRRIAQMRRGAFKVVYAAPERLAHEGFLEALSATGLSMIAVDEAHCIAQWGHDFRPDYLRIGGAIERLRPPRVLACTATATEDAREEIVAKLGLRRDEVTVILRGFARPNLHLSVAEVSGPSDALKRIERALGDALGSPRKPSGAAIVYAATRKGAEQAAGKLAASGWNAEAYHAGMSPEERARVSAGFADRSVGVVVATNAFGMGIDRPDVRLVAHAQPSASIEAYYQEVGRAGRDGEAAVGLLCIAGVDIALRRRLCMTSSEGGPASPAEVARSWGLFREVLRYVDAASCRHDFILRYFGDEAESLGGCGHCDVCERIRLRRELEGDSGSDAARDADLCRRALAGVARAKGRAGMQAVAAMLRGDATERVRSQRLHELSTFGVLKERSQDEVMAILRVVLAAGWIDITTDEYPMPFITPSGWEAMRGKGPLPVCLDSVLARPSRKVLPRRRPVSTPERKPAEETPRPSDVGAGNAGKREVEISDEAVASDPLFSALRAHRAEIAKRDGVPAYVVATDKTLADLVRRRPASAAELEDVYGMGPRKIERYGEGLLEVLRGHAGEA